MSDVKRCKRCGCLFTSVGDVCSSCVRKDSIDMFKLNCGLKIATGTVKPPKELLDLADIYIPLNELPDFIRMIDKNGIKCYNQLAEGGN